MSVPEYRLRVLGPVTVRHLADPPASSCVTQPRQLALLVYLALARPRGLHTRDTLIALLWPELDQSRGRKALRNALHGLRRRLGSAAIVTAGDHLVGLDRARVSCDGIDLELGREVELEPPHHRAVVEPLAGFHVAGAVEYDRWMSAERERLRRFLTDGGVGAEIGRGQVHAVPRLHSVDASVLYARGHYLFLRSAHGGSTEELLASRDCFERARALDPTFAPAFAGLANFYAVAARRGTLKPFHPTFAEALSLSRQAHRMDPTLAVPHVHFAVQALYLEHDWERAGREFECAVRKDPEYAEGHRFRGVWLGLVKRHDEALREMELAARLEPDVPHLLSSLAAARLAVGDREGAEVTLRRTLELDPAHKPARERLLRILEDGARYEECVVERMREPVMEDGPSFAVAFADGGAEGYRRTLRTALSAEAEALEEQPLLAEPSTPNDIFAPPVLRLVALLTRLGESRRAKAWRLQATAVRPDLGPWFASLREREGI